MKTHIVLVCLLPLLSAGAGPLPSIQTVFVIVMENHSWSDILESSSAPYLNGTVLPMASYCTQYFNPPGNHPSEPNYLWLEAGTNFGIYDDSDPSVNHQNTTDHLVSLLRRAGITWKTYQEDISGTYVPLAATNRYAPKHNPFVFFDDVTGTNDPSWPYGIAHIRPYGELSGDLASGQVAQYNFISPNLCHDMHDSCAPAQDPVRQGDDWLSAELPALLHSTAYQNHGAIFITWDESNSGDGPIGMILLSPQARGAGYQSSGHFTHSSLLRTVQEIFGVTPLLGDAANALDLSDLFGGFRFSAVRWLGKGVVALTASGLLPGSTNLVQVSTNLAAWTVISTNYVPGSTFTFTNQVASSLPYQFYRLVRSP